MSETAHLLASYPGHRLAFPVYSDRLAKKKAFLRVCNAVRERIFSGRNHPRTIVVTGTNGKGSVVSILACLLQHAGHRVGTITSPAMRSDSTDMVRIDGEDIDAGEFLALLKQACADIGAMRVGDVGVTHYMLICHAAYRHFAAQRVDFVVAETAIGGGYDPTVPFAADFCVFTNVTCEHLDVLGPTLNDVCNHKSHIIGPGSKAICASELSVEHFRILERRAARRHATLMRGAPPATCASNAVLYDDGVFSITDQYGEAPEYQRSNVALAVSVLRQIDAVLPAMRIDVRTARPRLFPKYRFESVKRGNVQYIFDCAHNEDSFEKLLDALRSRFDLDSLAYIRAAGNQWDIDTFAAKFKPRKVVYVSGFHPRIVHRPGFIDISSFDPDTIEAYFGSEIIVVVGIFLSPHIYSKVTQHG